LTIRQKNCPEARHANQLTENPFNNREVIGEKSLESHFQPIYSIKRTRTVGLEALARPMNPVTRNPINPCVLFREAGNHGLSLELDRLCRRRALEGFANFADEDPDILLFMNINTAFLNETAAGSNAILNLVCEFSVPPERVVLEIVENQVHSEDALMHFVSTYRNHGFLIALDDMGAGHSNLARISLLKPDIIKLDRSLISDIDTEFHKQELFELFIRFAHRIGVMVIAEGVETQTEALTCLDRGADLAQGFYFSRPLRAAEVEPRETPQRVGHVKQLLKYFQVAQRDKREAQYKSFAEMTDVICQLMSAADPEAYDRTLLSCLENFPVIECAYILSSAGVQVSDTVFNPHGVHPARRRLYVPSTRHTDQSSKDYFMFVTESQRRFITESYISGASGNPCITISTLTTDQTRCAIVVCVDIDMSKPVED